MIELPTALADGIAEEAAALDPRRLARLGEELSQRYRGAPLEGRRAVRDVEHARAYAAWLLPATHAQVAAALASVVPRVGKWRPRTLLDLGAGPGPVAWAAAAAFPGLERVRAVEREEAFAALGRRLAARARHAAVREAAWDVADVREAAFGGSHDVVVLAHVLAEIPERDRPALVERAWTACAGVLLIVEPGTPAGFSVVRAARERVLRRAGRTLAPCPHDEPCPLEGDWCHFAERAQRPEPQRRVKGASLPWEDVKLSFAALSRFPPATAPWARVVGAPRRARHLLDLSLCTASGLRRERVPKSRGDAYRLAKKLSWGDAVLRAEDLGAAAEAPPPGEPPTGPPVAP